MTSLLCCTVPSSATQSRGLRKQAYDTRSGVQTEQWPFSFAVFISPFSMNENMKKKRTLYVSVVPRCSSCFLQQSCAHLISSELAAIMPQHTLPRALKMGPNQRSEKCFFSSSFRIWLHCSHTIISLAYTVYHTVRHDDRPTDDQYSNCPYTRAPQDPDVD